jgi:hypothetical protein
MEGQVRLELTTSRFGILRDVHFRFWPALGGADGFEPPFAA